MRTRLFSPLLCTIVLTAAALFTGSRIFWTGSALLALIILTGFIAVRQTARSLKITEKVGSSTVRRGDDTEAIVRVAYTGILPCAPIEAELAGPVGGLPAVIRLHDIGRGAQELRLPFHAAHVGAVSAGIRSCRVEDLFGIFSETVTADPKDQQILVLPSSFQVEDMPLAIGDSGFETMARATEDVSNPADVRTYQPGDSLKKIHWKLSLRKQELMVRRFEEPVMPDTLILMDCSAPPAWGHAEAEADFRDCMLETASSLMRHEIESGHNPVMPLLGTKPIVCDRSMPPEVFDENLARLDFSETDRFERVLQVETRRMRRAGAVQVIAARMNGSMADILIRMRRMGPYVRLYLITFTPDDPHILPIVRKLQQGSVEVRYVSPSPV